MLPKVALILAVVAGGGFPQSSGHAPAPATAPSLPLDVRVTAPATIELIDPVAINAPIAGRIGRVFVEQGSRIRAGQVLATIVDEQRGRELERADADVSRARANEEQVRASVHDALVASGSARATDVAAASTRAAELAAARAAVERAGARAAELHRRALRAEIKAPIGGTIVRSELVAGASVRAKAPLFVIARNVTGLRVIAEVDEAESAMFTKNTHVTFSVAESPGRELEGKLVSVQKRRAIIEVSDPGHALRAGMTASVTFAGR